MNKWFALPLLAILAACGGNADKHLAKPYKFNRDRLDSLVKQNKAIHDISKRSDGSIAMESYYLGDSVKYKLLFDEKSKLTRVYKFNEHGNAQWYELYYSNGQRKGHYMLDNKTEHGEIVENGPFETYYEDGKVKEIGAFQNGFKTWELAFDKEGVAGDTSKWEYVDDTPKPDTTKPAPIKVEKIPSKTTPN